MKTWTRVVMGGLLLALTATQVSAQTGAEVEQTQKALKQLGHDPGPIDGVMGAQTQSALRAYQREQGLSATGRLDDATLAKLGQSSATGGSGAKPSAVDPAQATKTGANAGEGASYSRSTEKGASTMSGADQKK
jgi:peptidoglycan hydrolase-like protein with peptidoglycan-binding domain